MKTPPKKSQVFQQSVGSVIKAQCSTSLAVLRRFAVLLAAVIVTASFANAANLLSNGDFNTPSSGAIPTGWTKWTVGSGYANHEITTALTNGTYNPPPNNTGNFDGTYEMTLGAGAANGSGGGVYQIVGGAPNVQYTLIVDAGVQGWWLPTGQIRLIFLNASSVGLATNVVNTTDSVHNPDKYDFGVPWQEWTNIAVSPASTTQVKVEFAGYGGGSCWFDNAVLTAPVVPPVIANLYPNGTVLEQNTNKLAFNATSALSITNIIVILNGVDVSTNLVISGTPTSRSVSYTNLQPNSVYNIVITVTDSSGSSTFENFTFDTFAPSFSWEAEDYDYGSGQFINNPILSSTPVAGSYFGVAGMEGIDFHDRGANGPRNYRSADPMSTDVSGDITRQIFVDAGVSDYMVGYFDGAGFAANDNVGLGGFQPQEWLNYTRTNSGGSYNIYARIASGNGPTATVHVSKVLSGQGTSSQTTSEIGVFNFPAYGWGSYNYVPMTDRFGNKVAVNLSGTNTLRVSAGSGANLNFFMLVLADTNTPTITGVYPDGSTLVQGTNKLTFTVSSASHSIAQSNVVVTLNGVTTNSLVFTGSASSWNVSVPLALNVTNYTAVITVTDNVGNSHATMLYFDTFNPASYDIEAEDFDFSGGQYIDKPVITSNAADNSYFDKAGTSADEYAGDNYTVPNSADYRFRELDYIATSVCSDTPMRDVVAAQLINSLAFNYNVGWWSTNGWLNYTHNYPAGNYNVYARLAGNTGNTNMIQLDEVDASLNYLGTFTEIGRGYNAFDWIPLVNTNSGQLATVTLGGLATLRTTTITGNVNPNSYLLVPVVSAPVPLQWNYSAGVLTLSWTDAAFHLQSQTNALGVGLSTNWSNYPGGGSSPVIITADKSLGTVFFRLSN